MGAISDFIAAFHRDRDQYFAIEKEVEALCKDRLRNIDFLWQSRVKEIESLEKKLRARIDEYNNESENVADVKDLVAGRIVLARWLDFKHVEEIVNQNFNLRDRAQHPKDGQNAVNLQARFRGYDGLHFHVTRRGLSNNQARNPVIEIQVMSAYMWAFSTLEHDIIYKKLHGKPDEALVKSLDLLKGIANLGEIGLQIYDERGFPVAKLSSQQRNINPDLQATIQTVAAKVNFDEKDEQCLRDLRLTDPRHDKERIEASKDQLLEGSCSWVFDDPAFVDWWTRDDSWFLWIHGDPGKGKTMMMMALISEVSERLSTRPGSNVLSYFFCQKTSDNLNSTVSVIRGLIYLLVDQEKTLIRHIRKSYAGAGKELFEGPNALYALRVIFLDMLKDPSLRSVYFMVDALDECDPKVHELLEWIVRKNPEVSPKIKWLTTSRNEPAFVEQLGHGRQLHTSLELNSLHIKRAVAEFIDHKVNELADLKSYGSELQYFVQNSLLEKAEGTFLWVALVCKELRQVRKQKAKAFLEKIPAGLEPLYERMLNQVFRQENKDDIELCRRILCLVTLAFRPLRLGEIAVFAEISEISRDDLSDLEDLVSLCGSFITVREETAYLVHQSAKDYLSDVKRLDVFHAGQEHEHANTARLCLEVMSGTLKKDICNFQRPGICLSEVDERRVEACIPLHAQYASLYWVDHLQQAGPTKHESLGLCDGGQVYRFFQRHFLHWFEVLSLIKRLSVGVLLISKLENMLGPDKNLDLYDMIYDARRFALNYRSIAEEAPLQLYVSALLFSPKKSIIRKCYIDQNIPWITRYPIIENDWSSSLQTFEGHPRSIGTVMFSPDGKQLASNSEDGTVRLWETATGALQFVLEGYRDLAARMNINFSSDGKLLVLSSTDREVQLWDTATGMLQRTLKPHLNRNRLTTLAISPDGRHLVTASFDGTVWLWDTATELLHRKLESHLERVKVITFSSDNKQFATGSDDNTVQLWVTVTGILQHKFKGHSGGITAITFSPDNEKLATGSSDKKINLWEKATKKLQYTFNHPDEILDIIFSPDGKHLTSCSGGLKIRLWSTVTGTLRYTIGGFTILSSTVTFSPDSKRLASISKDNKIQIWKVSTRTLQQTLKGHSNFIKTIAFSPNGKQLASGSVDRTVRIWETGTIISQRTLESYSNDVTQITFSPDGKKLALRLTYKIVQLWDTATGTLQHTLKSYWDEIKIVRFSPDSKQLAWGSSYGTVLLWETATGKLQYIIQGHSLSTTTLDFSPDGKQLASGPHDHAIWLSETTSGTLQRTFEGYPSSTNIIKFSPNGKQLASSSLHSRNTIWLWETATGTLQRTLEGNSLECETITFSPDSKQLASGSFDGTVHLWETATRTSKHRLEGHSSYVLSVAFSPDGKQLASSSNDNTVRLWDTAMGKILRVFDISDVTELGIAADSSYIQTNCGQIQLTTSSSIQTESRSISPGRWLISDDWLLQDNCKMLWLPVDFRSSLKVHQDSLFAIGHRSGPHSGQVTFLKLDPSFSGSLLW